MSYSTMTKIKLNRYKPREYQLPIVDAIENKGYKRVLAILPRRAGKDITAFNICIRECLRRVGTVFYIFPTFSQGRRILWDGIQNDGMRILDYIPEELIESKNEQQMRIRFKNGSTFQVLGSDSYDNTLVGTNATAMVFSEWALSDPRAYQFARPILTANNGWALFITTPRGKNHLWEMKQIAENSPDWYYYHVTINETQHISLSEIERERRSGEMSEDLIQQEYYCSFEMGVEGSYYAKNIDRIRNNGQISIVPWEPQFPVHTSWDIGVRDSTCIIFYQIVGQIIRIIDCYDKNKEGLDHYIHHLSTKEYTYGKHFAPHDIAVKEWGSGLTRIEKARQLGIKFQTVSNVSIQDGIESLRAVFPKLWIDEKNCAPLIKALENYRQEYDAKRKTYKPHPLHDWSSHYADCARYMALSLPKTRDGLSAKDLDKRYHEAVYGNRGFPDVFVNRDWQKY